MKTLHLNKIGVNRSAGVFNLVTKEVDSTLEPGDLGGGIVAPAVDSPPQKEPTQYDYAAVYGDPETFDCPTAKQVYDTVHNLLSMSRFSDAAAYNALLEYEARVAARIGVACTEVKPADPGSGDGSGSGNTGGSGSGTVTGTTETPKATTVVIPVIPAIQSFLGMGSGSASGSASDTAAAAKEKNYNWLWLLLVAGAGYYVYKNRKAV